MDSAITRAVTKFPFFAPGILHLIPIETTEIKTASTNGKDLRFNPEWIKSLSGGQRVFLVLHEWCHVMMYHHLIDRNGLDLDVLAMAVDYCVNGFLVNVEKDVQGSMEFITDPPYPMLYDKRFDGMTWRQIYDILIQGSQSDESKMAATMGMVEGHPDPNASREGTSENSDAIEDVKAYVMAGAQSAKLAGKLSAELERQLGLLVEPKIDWRSELAIFIQAKAKDDYSFMKKNPRYSHVIMPSLYSEAVDCLAFSVDTSGSISSKELHEFSADTIAAFESVVIKELIVIWCDSDIKGVERFSRGEDIQLHPKGGGGTDFAPPFNWLEQEGIEPVGMIYLTDGYCDDFAPTPPYDVLWCVYGGNKNFNPPYGKVIQVDF
jgi:predicted metal-dependent peptidase